MKHTVGERREFYQAYKSGPGGDCVATCSNRVMCEILVGREIHLIAAINELVQQRGVAQHPGTLAPGSA